jgi:hypothetical protein
MKIGAVCVALGVYILSSLSGDPHPRRTRKAQS